MSQRLPDVPTSRRPSPARRRGVAMGAGRGRRRLAGFFVTMVACGLGLVGCSGGGGGGGEAGPIPGLQTFANLSQEHVTTPVSYPQEPPVGGDHSPQLQPCGAYGQPVPNERAVHSMEHGAVWVTYRPDLPPADSNRLNDLAKQTYVLVSPYAGLPAPVVASAWGVQLRLDSPTDPRLERFVATYRQGPQAPEPGAPCPQVQGG